MCGDTVITAELCENSFIALRQEVSSEEKRGVKGQKCHMASQFLLCPFLELTNAAKGTMAPNTGLVRQGFCLPLDPGPVITVLSACPCL